MRIENNLSIRLLIILPLLASVSFDLDAQSYAVQRAGFSSDRFNDFSPVYYRNGLVFSSQRKHDLMLVYASPDDQ